MRHRVTVSFDVEAHYEGKTHAVQDAIRNIEEHTVYALDLIDVQPVDTISETRYHRG